MPEYATPILILRWNHAEECLRTAEAMLGQPLAPSIRVIDNASDPDALRSLPERLPAGVKLLRTAERSGL